MCSPDRLQLVGEVLAAGRRGVEVALDHHRQATEKQKAHHDEQNIEWSWSSETVCGSVAIACSPTDDTVTVLALHGRSHTGDTLVRNLQAWDGFAESANCARSGVTVEAVGSSRCCAHALHEADVAARRE